MKNSTLLVRSLFLIILIAGSAHLVTYASQKNTKKFSKSENKVLSDTTTKKHKRESKSERSIINLETDYIIGKWKVTYNSKEFKGAIVYEIKKEDNMFNAYILKYQDENGNSQKAESIKTLVIKSFDGYQGKGQYLVMYKGEKYDVECNIDMLDNSTFKLSYDSYGYDGIEIWKKQ
ncbi:hypothetical protein [Aquimarina sp. Aq78]|uniref:hypothetical protein n=1 Tax=Aquimarina sp. Aq78 TaxID=1191889 RepID=UPI000D1012E4|nr:hypothetical protein [Aquimarina sp. Aq78]